MELNEPKSLTLEEAKTEIQEWRKALANGPSWAHVLKAQVEALNTVLSILARVKPEIDEEDRAVLWFIKEKKKPVCITEHGWEWQQFEDEDEWYPFNPTEEARKLGWGG